MNDEEDCLENVDISRFPKLDLLRTFEDLDDVEGVLEATLEEYEETKNVEFLLSGIKLASEALNKLKKEYKKAK